MWLNSVLSKCVGLCNIGSWREGMQNYVGSQAGSKQLVNYRNTNLGSGHIGWFGSHFVDGTTGLYHCY